MTPSWYDLLDVRQDATADEVRAAWKSRIADLDPGDRRFAVLNRAAKVLLDPEARAAYDAELAAQPDDPEESDEADEAPVATAAPVEPSTRTPAQKTSAQKTPAQKTSAQKTSAQKTSAEPAARRPLARAVVAGVVALAFTVVGVLAWTGSEDQSELEDGYADARSAAEQAVVPILSYDATDLEAGRSSALGYLTDEFAEDYEALFDGIVEQNAPELGTRAEATFLSSGIVRADGDRVQVLVFVDQSVTNNASSEPRIFSNQVTVTMEQVGDRWLVDDLETTAGS